MPFCEKCGNQVKETDLFCRHCGYKLENGHQNIKGNTCDQYESTPHERIQKECMGVNENNNDRKMSRSTKIALSIGLFLVLFFGLHSLFFFIAPGMILGKMGLLPNLLLVTILWRIFTYPLKLDYDDKLSEEEQNKKIRKANRFFIIFIVVIVVLMIMSYTGNTYYENKW